MWLVYKQWKAHQNHYKASLVRCSFLIEYHQFNDQMLYWDALICVFSFFEFLRNNNVPGYQFFCQTYTRWSWSRAFSIDGDEVGISWTIWATWCFISTFFFIYILILTTLEIWRQDTVELHPVVYCSQRLTTGMSMLVKLRVRSGACCLRNDFQWINLWRGEWQTNEAVELIYIL